jgi:hypothetical protein
MPIPRRWPQSNFRVLFAKISTPCIPAQLELAFTLGGAVSRAAWFLLGQLPASSAYRHRIDNLRERQRQPIEKLVLAYRP